MEGLGPVEFAPLEVVVAEGVEQAGAHAVVPGAHRVLEPAADVGQRVLRPSVAQVGHAEPAVGAGEHALVAQALRELQLLQVALEGARVVRERPVEPAEQVEEVDLQPPVPEGLGAAEALAGGHQAEAVVAAPPVQVRLRHEGPQGLGVAAGGRRRRPRLVGVRVVAVDRRGGGWGGGCDRRLGRLRPQRGRGQGDGEGEEEHRRRAHG